MCSCSCEHVNILICFILCFLCFALFGKLQVKISITPAFSAESFLAELKWTGQFDEYPIINFNICLRMC